MLLKLLTATSNITSTSVELLTTSTHCWDMLLSMLVTVDVAVTTGVITDVTVVNVSLLDVFTMLLLVCNVSVVDVDVIVAVTMGELDVVDCQYSNERCSDDQTPTGKFIRTKPFVSKSIQMSLIGVNTSYKSLLGIDSTQTDIIVAGTILDTSLSPGQPVLTDGNGYLVSGQIKLASEVAGVLPIANGGTNSSTALYSGYVMASSGGKIVEVNGTATASATFVGDFLLAPTFIGASDTTMTVEVNTGQTGSLLYTNNGNDYWLMGMGPSKDFFLYDVNTASNIWDVNWSTGLTTITKGLSTTGTASVEIGNDAATALYGFGVGAGVKTVGVGSTHGASTTNILSGSGGTNIYGGTANFRSNIATTGAVDISLGSDGSAATLELGNVGATTTVIGSYNAGAALSLQFPGGGSPLSYFGTEAAGGLTTANKVGGIYAAFGNINMHAIVVESMVTLYYSSSLGAATVSAVLQINGYGTLLSGTFLPAHTQYFLVPVQDNGTVAMGRLTIDVTGNMTWGVQATSNNFSGLSGGGNSGVLATTVSYYLS
jgi:hypothetical protein